MKGIYKFYANTKNGSKLEGIFTERSCAVDLILGKVITLAPPFNNYVETLYLDVGTITLCTDDPDVVSIFQRYNMDTGFNPFLCLDDSDVYWNFIEPEL